MMKLRTCAASLLMLTASVAAQDYPTRPIRIVVPFPPGANLHAPELAARLKAQGLDVVGNTPEQFAAYMRAEIDKWSQVVKATGARID